LKRCEQCEQCDQCELCDRCEQCELCDRCDQCEQYNQCEQGKQGTQGTQARTGVPHCSARVQSPAVSCSSADSEDCQCGLCGLCGRQTADRARVLPQEWCAQAVRRARAGEPCSLAPAALARLPELWALDRAALGPRRGAKSICVCSGRVLKLIALAAGQSAYWHHTVSNVVKHYAGILRKISPGNIPAPGQDQACQECLLAAQMPRAVCLPLYIYYFTTLYIRIPIYIYTLTQA